MAKKKTKKILKKEEPESIPQKKPGMDLATFFVIQKIRPHRQSGMLAYKNAENCGQKTLKEWIEFFKDY